MNNASPFYIYISDTPITSAGTSIKYSSSRSSSSDSKKTKTSSSKDGIFISKYIVTRVAESAVHTVEMAYANHVSSIGYLEGDYTRQNDLQQELNICKKVANSALTAGVALATGHPVVAAIDVAVSIVNMAISNYYDNQEKQALVRTQNYNSEQLSTRAGLSSTRDGSRGTEN